MKYSELEKTAISAADERFDYTDYIHKVTFKNGFETGAQFVVDLVEEQLLDFRLMDEQEKSQKVLELLYKLSHLTTPV